MNWNSLISLQNLRLAWRRINTARNNQYKRFFREAFLVYEASVEENLRELHRTLAAKIWMPTHATRVYIPKPSGLQRPLSLIDIEDQIVLQALANKVATRLTARRHSVELQSVFSSQLGERGSIFFTEPWNKTYPLFQKRCEQAYRAGQRWAADFDLAAYYDTISHDLLLSIASVSNEEHGTLETMKSWLSTWSADSAEAVTGHGIPQGPAASDFLAEAFFLPIDLKLQRSPITYIRYVDDIRLFGSSEAEVREVAINLEQECRHRGLIPQSSKFEIREVRSIAEAIGSLPSIPPLAALSPVTMSNPRALRTLKSTISGKPYRITDKSRFRFVMYRAPATAEILNLVLRLLPRHPEHIDAFIAYFDKYQRSSRIVSAAIAYLESGVPYSYVRGELWHLIARLGSDTHLGAVLPMARADARIRGKCIALSWGVMHYFIKCDEKGIASFGSRLSNEHPISRALLAPIFPQKLFEPDKLIVDLLKGRLCEQFAGVRELQRRNVTLNRIGLRQRNVPESCRRAVVGLGVARRLNRLPNNDWIAQSLATIYGCNNQEIWRRLLGSEYEHAYQILIEAKTQIDINRSGWLNQQDSFNDAVIRRFFGFLQSKGLPGHSVTVSFPSGALVDYGTLLQPGAPFDATYPAVASALRQIHNRRNSLPSSHPYQKHGGARNQYLKKVEQVTLVVAARKALDAIAVEVATHP